MFLAGPASEKILTAIYNQIDASKDRLSRRDGYLKLMDKSDNGLSGGIVSKVESEVIKAASFARLEVNQELSKSPSYRKAAGDLSMNISFELSKIVDEEDFKALKKILDFDTQKRS